ncbi:hypothetical protein CA267_013355 [Alteromonas pelagimontana]|uniref:Uncharacterized protein n=1 Tax=Alteromonas pelagimontana TaxID=1858656 RepID=A0A6M4MF26_9ALTE|nr:hypothetical protein [Alteromonas pelagimontana]QJR81683.1 hypothetical protein CA267_013355 [Alteromonas pelagimontana]
MEFPPGERSSLGENRSIGYLLANQFRAIKTHPERRTSASLGQPSGGKMLAKEYALFRLVDGYMTHRFAQSPNE